MGAGHSHALYVHEHSLVHRLPPQCKIVAALAFVVAVVATPREAVPAFAAYAVALAATGRLGRIPVGFVARRLLIEVPFVLFAVALPFLSGGERVDVGPVAVSVEGLWGAWNILAKATLGLATTVLLVATTELPDLLRGLERLRVPRAFTSVAGFMVRYLDVIAGEARRMSVARRSRGHDPRWLWQARAVAHSAAALFIRSYERGERVHLAMLSRGYSGTLPSWHDARAEPRAWLAALSLPATATIVALASWASVAR